MSNPLISIIVPVHNAAAYIGECIESILRQTYTDWELLLINDGSTDDSMSICADYARNNHKIRLINLEWGG